MSLIVFFFTVLWSSFLLAQSSQSFEEKIYNIYKSSYSSEISDKLWSQYIVNSGTRSYKVSEGDTLWNLSEVFFGNGHYWSKIWSYNERVTNPHLILVGQNILFFTGSIEEPPSLTIENKDENKNENKEGSQVGDGTSPEDQIADTAFFQISIPPPKEKIAAVRSIPPVFSDKEKYDINKFDGEKIKMDMHASIGHILSIPVEAFLYDKNVRQYPKRVGQVLESEESKKLLGLNDIIYIESKDVLNVGEEFTVMDKNYVIRSLFRYFGSVVSYLGRVRVINDLGNDHYRAEVFESFGEIRRGAWLSRENIPSFFNDYKGPHSSLELDVIGGGAYDKITIFSQNDVIFLNGGSEQGLKKGDILGIYSKRSKRYKDTLLKMSPDPIAHIKIFNLGKKVASAFVLDASEAIIVGDKTGNPIFMVKSDSKGDFSKDLGVEGEDFQPSTEEDLGAEAPPGTGESETGDLGVEVPGSEGSGTENSEKDDLGIE